MTPKEFKQTYIDLQKKQLQDLLEKICKALEVEVDEVKGDLRKQDLVYARVCYCILSRILYKDIPVKIIGDVINRGYPTVCRHSNEKPIEMLWGNKKLAEAYEKCLVELKVYKD